MRLLNENDVYALFAPNGTARLHVADIDALPRVDAMEVVHGRWILADDGDGDVCSVCGTDFCNIIYETGNWNYCPNCGAKMDLEVENEE